MTTYPSAASDHHGWAESMAPSLKCSAKMSRMAIASLLSFATNQREMFTTVSPVLCNSSQSPSSARVPALHCAITSLISTEVEPVYGWVNAGFSAPGVGLGEGTQSSSMATP